MFLYSTLTVKKQHAGGWAKKLEKKGSDVLAAVRPASRNQQGLWGTERFGEIVEGGALSSDNHSRVSFREKKLTLCVDKRRSDGLRAAKKKKKGGKKGALRYIGAKGALIYNIEKD